MDFYPILLTISLLIVVSGLLVIKIERWLLTEPIVAMLLGALLSPYALDLIDPQQWGDTHRFLKLAAMLTISMSLMSAAYQLPPNYPIEYKKTQAVILLLIMPLMFALSGILAYWTLDLPLALAFLVGAVITPTDPVVSATIVSGKFAEKYLPDSIRHTITFESAANDGLAYPLVMMMLFILGYYDADSTWEWLLRAVGWETIGAAAMGLAIGYGLGRAVHAAHQRGWMNDETLLSFTVAFGFLVLSLVEVMQANGILAVFAGGFMVLRCISQREELRESHVQEMMKRLFTIPIFFLFGLMLPLNEWLDVGWPLLLFGGLVMLLRRLPAFVLLRPLLPRFRHRSDIFFLGWFGPVGVAALFYTMHVLENTPYREVWPIVSFVIFVSTLIHGLTSLPLSRWYARKTGN